MIDEKDYDNGIEFLFKCKKSLPISAIQDNHKLAIFRLFLREAKSEIRILMRGTELLQELKFGIEQGIYNGIDIKKLIYSDTRCEFFVMDSHAFWYHDLDRNIAFANFNNSKECKKLLKLFGELE